MLELRDISKTLGTFSLEDISFEVNRGAYFVMLGESGAGKSVLLEIIAGLHRPDSGRVHYEGEDITAVSIQSRGFGLVYQDQSLFPHMNVEQNIAYPLKQRHGRVRDDRIRELAEKFGITHLLKRNAATLSLGEAQRAALARTLARKPDLLLLDEPLASLDVQAKANMRSLLRKLNSEGITIIHVTHDYREAISLADQLAVMTDGTIEQTGTPEEIFDHPKSEFIANFTGIRNFYKGRMKRLSSDLGLFSSGGLEFEIASDGTDGEGYMLLRTEDITLSGKEPESSQRNHFKGTVIDIEPARLGMEVMISLGNDVHITALVTKESFSSMGLRIDTPVWANFKATAARFLAH